MTDTQAPAPHKSAARTTLLGLFLAVAVLGAACGSATMQATSVDPNAPVTNSQDSQLGDATAPDTTGALDSLIDPFVEGTQTSEHNFGASLDEWTESEADSLYPEPSKQPSEGFENLDWNALIPPGFSSEEIWERFTARLEAVEAGSPEANSLYEEMQSEYDGEAINPDVDGKQVMLAGFVAPLTYEDDIIVEFLLVPNFGACIHVPPPPPNQTVMVTLDKANGLTLEESWGAVWVEGTLVVEPSTTDLAPASYTITNASSGVYQ